MANVKQLRVNGASVKVDVHPERSLLSVLRGDLDLTGAKYGCGEGQCGACTVLVEGRAVRSCITSVGEVAAKEITTIEGLEKNGRLHPVQQAFLDADALQCGYCTPGMVLSAVALLENHPRPTEQQIVSAMQGNICRCCTYPRIARAIAKASRSAV